MFNFLVLRDSRYDYQVMARCIKLSDYNKHIYESEFPSKCNLRLNLNNIHKMDTDPMLSGRRVDFSYNLTDDLYRKKEE
jgi:hypothetical protein